MNKRKFRLYLAHSFETRHEIRKIESEIENEFNIELYNPFYDCDDRNDVKQLDEGKKLDRNLASCEELVDRDLNAVDDSDGIVAIFLQDATIGTCLEIGYARQTGKLIFFISDKYYNHAWIRVYCDYRFKNIDEFKIFLKYYKFNPIIFKLKRKLKVIQSAFMILKIGITKLLSKIPRRKKKTKINIEMVK